MTISFLPHAGQFLELVANESVPTSLSTGLWLFACDRGNSEEKGFFGGVLKGVVDSSAEEDGLVADEGDEHEVVGGMRVGVEEVGGQQLL